jgi:hypothetical protein
VPTFHVLTVSPCLPVEVLEPVLTELERTLDELGASRVWIDPDRPAIAVMAELPSFRTPGSMSMSAQPGSSSLLRG